MLIKLNYLLNVAVGGVIAGGKSTHSPKVKKRKRPCLDVPLVFLHCIVGCSLWIGKDRAIRKGSVDMAMEYADRFGYSIADAMQKLLRPRKMEVRERVQEMVRMQRERNDPRIAMFADDVLRVSAFVEHAVYLAIMLCCHVRRDYLCSALDLDVAYDAASMHVEALWGTHCAKWVRGFRSSIVFLMIGDRKGLKIIAKDILPVVFTSEELVMLGEMADAREDVLSLIRSAEFIQTLGFTPN